MKRGISLVVLLVTIAVILIITSVTVVTGNNIFNNTKKVKFASEISYVEEIVNTYRLNNDGNFPSSKMIYLDSSKIKGNDLNEQFKDENIAEDKSILLYKIDFSMLNPHELTYTDINSDSGDNIYCISPKTGRVYFVQGVKIAGKKYYTLTDDLKKSINYVEDNNVNDGIIFLDDYKGNLKIKIPEKYAEINITSSNGEITVTQDSINEYKMYNVSYINESIITVSYEKDGKSKELKYNVSQVSKDKPEFNISEIKTMVNSKTGKEEKYVTLENVPSDIKIIKYSNKVLSESKIKEYFKTGGIEISKDDIITIPNNSFYYITVYIEDKYGNYNHKKIFNENNSYIKSNLILQVDGILNTLNGHNDSTDFWYDLSGNGNNLTLENVSWTDDSAVFNESLAYIDNTVENITVEMVVKEDTSKSGPVYIGWFGDKRHMMAYYDNNCIQFSSGVKFYQLTNNYTRNTISAIYKSTTDVIDKCYINSKLGVITSTSDSWSKDSEHYIQIGKYSIYNSYRFAGEICAIRIYNRALTEEEIKHNYEIDKIRFGL